MEQKLEHFVAELRLDINKFERYWVKKNKEDPIQFKMELDSIEWIEQFLIWCDLAGTSCACFG